VSAQTLTAAPAAAVTVPVNVIGIDPSLTGTGIASSRGWVELVGQKDVTKLPLLPRIAAVARLAAEVVQLVGQPDLVVIERPAFSRSGGGAVERHALWFEIVRSLIARQIPVAEAANQHRMRYATGKGSAQKNAIVDAVARRLPLFDTSGNDNLCDAAVLCALGCDWLGHPLAVMPATHRRAVTDMNWPDLGVRGMPR